MEGEVRIPLADYLAVLHTSPEEVLYIQFDDENRTIKVTNKNLPKTVLENVDERTWNIFRSCLPGEFVYKETIHTRRGNFSVYSFGEST